MVYPVNDSVGALLVVPFYHSAHTEHTKITWCINGQVILQVKIYSARHMVLWKCGHETAKVFNFVHQKLEHVRSDIEEFSIDNISCY